MAIAQFIDNEVKGNDVVLFMKGTPQFPQCGFSGQVVQILDYLGVTYKGSFTFHMPGAKVMPTLGVYNGEGQNKLDANDPMAYAARLAV